MAKKEITIDDIPGVGEKIAEKLRDIGYTDLMTIAVTSSTELANIAEIGEGQAAKIISAVREMLDIGFESADKVLERKAQALRITTSSKNLDSILPGGVETQAITEVYGAFGASKSQIAFQLAVNVQLSPDKGGLGKNCLFVDTEGTFSPNRIVSMAKAAGLDPEQALKNIYVARAYNSDHQILLIEKAQEMIQEKNIGLIIIDSLTSHFRADYIGRGELAARQQKLNKHLHALQRMADAHNISIYVTNQVMARPDVLFGDPTQPIGGHVLAHQCLTPDTLVQLSGGAIIEAKRAYNPLTFSGINFGNLKQSEGKCSGVFRIKKDSIIEINRSLKISPEHTVFKVNGLDIVEVEAKYLEKGDYLIVPKKLNIKGNELKIPEIKVEKVYVLSPKGSKIIKQRAKEKRIVLKRNHVDLFGITARQLRRVLNQEFPTKEEIIGKIESSLDIDLSKFVDEVETNKHKKIKIPDKLNGPIAQLFGYFIGDGNLFKNSLRFRDFRKEVLTEYNKLFLNEFGLSGAIKKIKNKNCFELKVSNKYISEMFRTLKNNYLYISKSTEDCIRGFVKGVFDAEGSITNNNLTLSNTDKKLLEFVKLLLLRFGVHSQVNKQGDAFKLSIKKDTEKFFENIGLTAQDKTQKLTKVSTKRDIIPIKRELLNQIFQKYGIKIRHDLKFITRAYLEKLCNEKKELRQIFSKILDSDLAFEKIRRIDILKSKEELIDISIPGIENFIANGYIVHNSTYRIYVRRGREGTRVAKMVDAPNLIEAEAIFRITEDGIRDVEK